MLPLCCALQAKQEKRNHQQQQQQQQQQQEQNIGIKDNNGGSTESQNNMILSKHSRKLRKIFSHFGQEASTSSRMEISEFVFMLRALRLMDTRLHETEATQAIIASVHYTGIRGYDLLSFADFCAGLLHIADYKTFDGVCDREFRINNFFKNELYPKCQAYTSLNTELW